MFYVTIFDRKLIKQGETRLDHEFAMVSSDTLCSVHYLFMTHKGNVTDKFIYKFESSLKSHLRDTYVCLLFIQTF